MAKKQDNTMMIVAILAIGIFAFMAYSNKSPESSTRGGIAGIVDAGAGAATATGDAISKVMQQNAINDMIKLSGYQNKKIY